MQNKIKYGRAGEGGGERVTKREGSETEWQQRQQNILLYRRQKPNLDLIKMFTTVISFS